MGRTGMTPRTPVPGTFSFEESVDDENRAPPKSTRRRTGGIARKTVRSIHHLADFAGDWLDYLGFDDEDDESSFFLRDDLMSSQSSSLEEPASTRSRGEKSGVSKSCSDKWTRSEDAFLVRTAQTPKSSTSNNVLGESRRVGPNLDEPRSPVSTYSYGKHEQSLDYLSKSLGNMNAFGIQDHESEIIFEVASDVSGLESQFSRMSRKSHMSEASRKSMERQIAELFQRDTDNQHDDTENLVPLPLAAAATPIVLDEGQSVPESEVHSILSQKSVSSRKSGSSRKNGFARRLSGLRHVSEVPMKAPKDNPAERPLNHQSLWRKNRPRSRSRERLLQVTGSSLGEAPPEERSENKVVDGPIVPVAVLPASQDNLGVEVYAGATLRSPSVMSRQGMEAEESESAPATPLDDGETFGCVRITVSRSTDFGRANEFTTVVQDEVPPVLSDASAAVPISMSELGEELRGKPNTTETDSNVSQSSKFTDFMDSAVSSLFRGLKPKRRAGRKSSSNRSSVSKTDDAENMIPRTTPKRTSSVNALAISMNVDQNEPEVEVRRGMSPDAAVSSLMKGPTRSRSLSSLSKFLYDDEGNAIENDPTEFESVAISGVCSPTKDHMLMPTEDKDPIGESRKERLGDVDNIKRVDIDGSGSFNGDGQQSKPSSWMCSLLDFNPCCYQEPSSEPVLPYYCGDATSRAVMHEDAPASKRPTDVILSPEARLMPATEGFAVSQAAFSREALESQCSIRLDPVTPVSTANVPTDIFRRSPHQSEEFDTKPRRRSRSVGSQRSTKRVEAQSSGGRFLSSFLGRKAQPDEADDAKSVVSAHSTKTAPDVVPHAKVVKSILRRTSSFRRVRTEPNTKSSVSAPPATNRNDMARGYRLAKAEAKVVRRLKADLLLMATIEQGKQKLGHQNKDADEEAAQMVRQAELVLRRELSRRKGPVEF